MKSHQIRLWTHSKKNEWYTRHKWHTTQKRDTGSEIKIWVNKSMSKTSKMPSTSLIPAEIFKSLGGDLVKHLKIVLQKIWYEGDVSQDFRYAVIVDLCKNKDYACCIYVRIPLTWTSRMVDPIFTLRQLQEKICQHQTSIS